MDLTGPALPDLAHFSSYGAIVGVVTHDAFDWLSDGEVKQGFVREERDRMLQTYVRNHYVANLQDILLTLQTEYTDWTEVKPHAMSSRHQVRRGRAFIF